MKSKVAIIVPGFLPVPSVKGGAIETLITGLIDINEKEKLMDISIFSPYNKIAAKEALKYRNSHFLWIRYSLVNKFINLSTRFISKIIKKRIPHFGILQIIHYLKKNNYDFVIIEGDDQIIIPVSSCVGVKKTYIHLHARLFSNPNAYNHCNKVIVVSDYIKSQVLINTRKASEDVIVLKNCTNISRFCRENNVKFRDTVRSKYNFTTEDVIICFTGRIIEEKGVRELIKSLMLVEENLHFKLLVVGSAGSNFGLSEGTTEYYSELLELSRKLNGKVIFTGFIGNDYIPKILAASDISVIPSLYEEPGALTIFESLAAGLPIVTTDSGGIPEYINDKCAVVIKRDEQLVQNLSLAINELIISKEKRENMGREGFLHVQQYNYDNYYSDLLRILTSE